VEQLDIDVVNAYWVVCCDALTLDGLERTSAQWLRRELQLRSRYISH